MDHFVDNIDFDVTSLAAQPLKKGEYDSCTFTGCDLSTTDLSGYRFIECTFINCNLSMVKMNKTVWNDIVFKDCKMLGIRWDVCDPFAFGISLQGCISGHASFYGLKLKHAKFQNTQLQEADFTSCDLSGSSLAHCDLLGATFDDTNLEKADLSTAINYNIDPERNKIKGARFALSGLPGLLDKYRIKVEGL